MGVEVKKMRNRGDGNSTSHNQSLPKNLILNSNIAVVPRYSLPQSYSRSDIQKIKTRKRILDKAFSIIFLILLLLLLPVFAILIKLSSRGPVFFKQKREGKAGKKFSCYKFRSMHISNEEKFDFGTQEIDQKRDHRIFKFGMFMRRNNLDELPQLLNVIKGEMSLVGPRPYMVSECRYWKGVFFDFKKREEIKPGMSGLAQVNGYRGGTLCKKHMRTRLNYDLIYVESYTLWVDIKIIGRTILQMLRLNSKAR